MYLIAVIVIVGEIIVPFLLLVIDNIENALDFHIDRVSISFPKFL